MAAAYLAGNSIVNSQANRNYARSIFNKKGRKDILKNKDDNIF